MQARFDQLRSALAAIDVDNLSTSVTSGLATAASNGDELEMPEVVVRLIALKAAGDLSPDECRDLIVGLQCGEVDPS